MKLGLVFLGICAWAGVALLAIGMAEWDKPVFGYFPILVAVLVAWGVGEYVSGRMTGGQK